MNTKVTAILCLQRDRLKNEADALEKELEAAQLAIKAQNYKIRINRLRKLQLEVQSLITLDAQAALDAEEKMKQDYPDWQTPADMVEQNK